MLQSSCGSLRSRSTGVACAFPVHASIRTAVRPSTVPTATFKCSCSNYSRTLVCKAAKTDNKAGKAAATTAQDDLQDSAPAASPIESIVDALDDITGQYRKLDEHFDKEYIESVVSLRDVLMEYEWRQHGKRLAERRGIAMFEQHCAENDVDVDFDCITELYNNPHDMSVLASNKLKLKARSIIQQTVDERYTSCYAECTQLAKELAKTGIKDMIPENAGKMAGAVKNLLPLPGFVKKLL